MLDTRLSFYGSFPEERGYSVIATIKLVNNCGYKQLEWLCGQGHDEQDGHTRVFKISDIQNGFL